MDELSFSAGHFTLTLKAGRVTQILAGDQSVGFFFVGSGRFEHVSIDPLEFSVESFNLKQAGRPAFETAADKLTIRGSVDEVLLLTGSRPPPALSGAAAPSLAAEFAAHRERFLKDAGQPVSHLFALHALNCPAAELVRAEIAGAPGDIVYVLDAGVDRTEALYELRRSHNPDPELRKFLWPALFSEQLIDRERRARPEPGFDLVDVDYTLVASDGNDARLSVKETIVPRRAPLNALRFDLFDTIYDQSGVGRLLPRHLRVASITDGAGRRLTSHHQDDELLVGLAAPAPTGQPLTLRFEIEGDFLIRPGGDNFWDLAPGPWFPQPEWAGSSYTLHSIVKVKKPFVPLASGVTVARREEGDYNVVENKFDDPVMFASALAGRYHFTDETRDGTTVRVASYGARNEIAAKQLANLTFQIIDYYQQFLGPFPFREYNIIEINSYGWGQAPPGIMFITKEAFNSQIGEWNQLFSEGINERFAHEIAHQYWGYVVKMPSRQEQWLSESFAEYCAGLFVKEALGNTKYKNLVQFWKSRAEDAHDAASIAMANRISTPEDPSTGYWKRTELIYFKGAFLLQRLHNELGDETFLTFLKSYQKSLRWKFGSTRDVIGLLRFMTKRDFKPFFDAYFWGTGMPE